MADAEVNLRRAAREGARHRDKERFWRQRAGVALRVIIKDWKWDEADAWEASPLRLEKSPVDDWRLLLESLYAADDVLWLGNVHDSGHGHADHFRIRGEWLDCNAPPGGLFCAATFAPGSVSRSACNVLRRPYIVTEADYLDPVCAQKEARGEPLSNVDKANNRAACRAVARWLVEECTLTLRALVDAGNKSVHAIFDNPGADVLMQLAFLTGRVGGLDAAVLNQASQPTRLPGVRRSGMALWQRLLFLNPIHQP
jgi:hypothetical protein